MSKIKVTYRIFVKFRRIRIQNRFDDDVIKLVNIYRSIFIIITILYIFERTEKRNENQKIFSNQNKTKKNQPENINVEL